MNNIKNNREYLNNIDPYLLELEKLANKSVHKSDLSSIDEIDKIRSRALDIKKFPVEKFKIYFSEKDEPRFNNYIQNLYSTNSEQVYLWTNKANICGLYKVNNIKDVNFSFPFELNNEGIVVFLSSDLKDKLLLDFSIDPRGNKIIDVEAQGLNWPNIKYQVAKDNKHYSDEIQAFVDMAKKDK